MLPRDSGLRPYRDEEDDLVDIELGEERTIQQR